MSPTMRDDQRKIAAGRRRKPNAGPIVHIPFEGEARFRADSNDPPGEIRLEATGPSGETAIWLDDFFWLELIQAWSRYPLTISIRPTRDSLLHPVILHQLSMLRRVTPKWRLVGQCYVTDLEDRGRLAQAALSVHHEIQVIDAPRSGAARSRSSLRIEDALLKIRKVQADHDRSTPTVVSCPSENERARRSDAQAEAMNVAQPVGAAM